MSDLIQEKETPEKELYDYQLKDLEAVFSVMDRTSEDYNLLYQLPTGGGKTVIFSEIVRNYIKRANKKVVILTHRIELSNQTSRMLTEFMVPNMIISSDVKTLEEGDDYMCYVAMVETLTNRLQEEQMNMDDVGLVIIDEAHYNSFRKLFSYFDKAFILGVTATPLSSNIKLPMKDNYSELLIGESIPELIKRGFLSKAKTISYNVGLSSLKLGINGDYTVKSSDILYTDTIMQQKLLSAYEDQSKGKKTLIFNNGINTSRYVYETFKQAGYDIRHLDNTNSAKERAEILDWFKNTPDAILTSVSILTTGFDEPTVDTIILNRATKSLTLYFQMIGRGSRIAPGKKTFKVLDLGNNAARFGFWEAPIDWKEIFAYPDFYLENLIADEEIERNFTYVMPPDLRKEFANTESVYFDIKKEYKRVIKEGLKAKTTLENAIEQHAEMVIENSEDVFDARILARKLKDDIAYRVRLYSYSIMNNTKNYRDWLQEDYERKLKLRVNQICRERDM